MVTIQKVIICQTRCIGPPLHDVLLWRRLGEARGQKVLAGVEMVP